MKMDINWLQELNMPWSNQTKYKIFFFFFLKDTVPISQSLTLKQKKKDNLILIYLPTLIHFLAVFFFRLYHANLGE